MKSILEVILASPVVLTRSQCKNKLPSFDIPGISTKIIAERPQHETDPT